MKLSTFLTKYILVLAILCGDHGSAQDQKQAQTVVFVCEHGSVKSLIASSFFNRITKERGLDARAVARGISPDEKVPERIANLLQEDGFDVRSYRPELLKKEDLKSAFRIVAMVEIPGNSKSVVRWDDVPPATTDYAASHDKIIVLIEGLISELKSDRK